MNADKLLLLQENLRDLENAATHLRFSINRTQDLLNQKNWQPEELATGRTGTPGIISQQVCTSIRSAHTKSDASD